MILVLWFIFMLCVFCVTFSSTIIFLLPFIFRTVVVIMTAFALWVVAEM